jgi:hypothetical protein
MPSLHCYMFHFLNRIISLSPEAGNIFRTNNLEKAHLFEIAGKNWPSTEVEQSEGKTSCSSTPKVSRLGIIIHYHQPC